MHLNKVLTRCGSRRSCFATLRPFLSKKLLKRWCLSITRSTTCHCEKALRSSLTFLEICQFFFIYRELDETIDMTHVGMPNRKLQRSSALFAGYKIRQPTPCYLQGHLLFSSVVFAVRLPGNQHKLQAVGQELVWQCNAKCNVLAGFLTDCLAGFWSVSNKETPPVSHYIGLHNIYWTIRLVVRQF